MPHNPQACSLGDVLSYDRLMLPIGVDAKCVDMKPSSTPKYKASLDAVFRLRLVLAEEERLELEQLLNSEIELGKKRAPFMLLENWAARICMMCARMCVNDRGSFANN